MRRGGTPSRFESLWLKVEGLRDLIKTGVWDMLSEGLSATFSPID